MGEISRRDFLNGAALAIGACLIPSTIYGGGFLSSTNQITKNAIDLLTAFSGEDAQQFAPIFKYSEESRIIDIEIHTVGTEDTSLRYTGYMEIWTQVNNILRIKTVDGYEGISGVISENEIKFSDKHLLELKQIVPHLKTLQSHDPVEVGNLLVQAFPNISDPVRASIDIALWDLAAKRADKPLYKILGAKRNNIQAYASLQLYDTYPEYIDAVKKYAKLGYNTFKFHVMGQIKKDIRLVEIIQETFTNSGYQFMMDLEEAYELPDAITLGKQMDKGLFIWFEGPMDDEQLDKYAALRRKINQKVIPAGYRKYSPEFIKKGIRAGAWDAGRFDVTTVGGISDSLELMIIANDANLPIEIQSWGHTLGQAANLHLMLANDLTTFFEASMPKKAYDFGMKNNILLEKGLVVVPKGPGLGIEVDWDGLANADYYKYSK